MPTASNPWNEYLAGHLLRRTMMAPTWSDIEALVALGDPGPAVDLLLNAPSTPATPSVASTAEQDPASTSNVTLQGTYLAALASDAAALRAWWENLQLTATNSIQEKMTALLERAFYQHVRSGRMAPDDVAQLLYIQNQLFRAAHAWEFSNACPSRYA